VPSGAVTKKPGLAPSGLAAVTTQGPRAGSSCGPVAQAPWRISSELIGATPMRFANHALFGTSSRLLTSRESVASGTVKARASGRKAI
jgi:hypothetical protein